jgi:hypothetical protein
MQAASAPIGGAGAGVGPESHVDPFQGAWTRWGHPPGAPAGKPQEARQIGRAPFPAPYRPLAADEQSHRTFGA